MNFDALLLLRSGFLKLVQVTMDIFTFDSSLNLCVQRQLFQVQAEYFNMIIRDFFSNVTLNCEQMLKAVFTPGRISCH